MSAFMVSKEHIDALVETALFGPTGLQCGTWFVPYFGKPSKKLYPENASELGEMLVKENLSSIHFRYPDTVTNPDNTPGPIEQYWLTEYQFHGGKHLSIIEALKAIRCYEYQSCEHPEWEMSAAKQFCESFTNTLISVLPGYDQAEWEIVAAAV